MGLKRHLNRRSFVREAMVASAAIALTRPLGATRASAAEASGREIRLGLCTYMWGHDWDLPTILANCQKAGVFAVELRTQHKHGVEPNLGLEQRKDVRKRFADSPITLVGVGTNECFDSPDPRRVKRSIEAAKAFVRLSGDCGGSGVKVKPNDFHPNVPHEKTIEQIGRALNELGRFAADFGQQIRLEIHRTLCELPDIKRIMDVADHPNVALCWNSNAEDLNGKGLQYNFNLVRRRLGATVHVHELNDDKYPYQQLVDLLVQANYAGWLLLECRSEPRDRLAAIVQQRALFAKMLSAAGKDNR